MKKLLSILALALCFVACQDEPKDVNVGNDLVDVVLNIDAKELSETRIKSGDVKSSAKGAIDFMTDADWQNYDLRYILEVYSANETGSGEPIYRERLVNCLDKYAPTTFSLRLVPNRSYKFVVFADFVAEGAAEAADKLAVADLYYNTADLRNISAITTNPTWGAMNEVRDAYFISANREIGTTGLTETLTLERPFAKLRVVTKDLDYINGYSAPGYVEVKYHTEKVIKSFNAVNGKLNADEMTGNELSYSFNINKNIPYSEGYDALATHQTLFTDYLFAVEGQQTAVNFEIAVYESKGGRLIHSHNFTTQIPIQRNHLTTIIGDLLTTQANIVVDINDNFDNEIEHVVDEDSKVLATPIVNYTVEGNKVNLTWKAIANAASYNVTVNNEAAVKVTDTAYSFTGAYETEYAISVVALPEDATYEASAAATLTVKTEAEPVVEPEEPVALATPVVKAEVDGVNVTLTWAAVEGAKEYFVNLPEEGESYTTTDLTFTYQGGYECTYLFEVTAVAADTTKNLNSEAATVTATTEKEPTVEPTYTSVADFLATEEDETVYTLKGTITSVVNTTYGNFDLTDETGTVYIYGLCSPEGAQKYWAESGAKLGDDIVIKTVRTSFNGTAQGKNATFVELTSPGTLAFWSFSKTATTFTSAGGEEKITVEAYNLKENVTVSSDNAHFTANYADGVLTITAPENTSTEAVNGNITVTAGALKQVIAVAQGGVTIGGGTEVTAEATMKDFGWANAAAVTKAEIDDNVTVKFFQGGASTAPAYYASGEAVRLYQNGAYMTVSANGKTIKSMEITFANNMYYVAADSGELTEEAATRTWTGEATEVKITCTGTDKSHRAYIAAIKVTYVD